MVAVKATLNINVHKLMTRKEYNDLRGWELPINENGCDDGFLYSLEGSAPNFEGYDGHIQWLPIENLQT